MAATHGKHGILYKWNGTGTALAAEACTVNGNDAQITDSAKRLLNPNSSDLAFTPTNSVNAISIDHVTGTCHFDAAPGVTTCAGTAGYVIEGSNLIKTAQLFEWSLDFGLEAHDITDFQDDWKAFAGGLAEVSGQIQGYIAGSNWWDDFEDVLDGTMMYFLLQLFSYDPDDDQTGDHYNIWALLNGFNLPAPVGEYIKETITFRGLGLPGFVANA